MGALIRLILLLLISTLVSLALVLLITSRGMDLNEALVNARWLLMLAEEVPVAMWAKEIWGLAPPYWARQICVVWEKAQPLQYWWLPIVIILLHRMVGAFARKKSR